MDYGKIYIIFLKKHLEMWFYVVSLHRNKCETHRKFLLSSVG